MSIAPSKVTALAPGNQATRISEASLHWPEYAIEAALLGLFMVSACLFTLLFQLPSSPARQVLPSPFIRRALTGVAMGLTAMALIYSPWGRRSGAHMNPSVTLTFTWLRKIHAVDGILYITFQFAGAALGVLLMAGFAGTRLADPNVQFAATIPGPAGALPAAFGEFVISFLQMTAVLTFSNHPRLSRVTGVVAGSLVATYIALESPFSGMSMNPARTFGSALPSGIWHGFAIYLLVPPIAMLAAAQTHLWLRGTESVSCCKLDHSPRVDCIFCGMKGNIDE
jgi:aquaporin Z